MRLLIAGGWPETLRRASVRDRTVIGLRPHTLTSPLPEGRGLSGRCYYTDRFSKDPRGGAMLGKSLGSALFCDPATDPGGGT